MDAFPPRVGFEWGAAAIRQLQPGDTAVIVDVLSFSTAATIAVARGASIIPWPERGESAAAQAVRRDALLAADRDAADTAHPYSLSPASLLRIPTGTRLVLPSPNGATLAAAAAARGATVLIGCLRNAHAVATACRQIGAPVAVVAAGERWRDDGSLRIALEDHIGAGAILAHLRPAAPSPEVSAAIALFRSVSRDLSDTLRACVSGQELLGHGYGEDVDLAAELNVSTTAPLLREGRLGAFTRPEP